MNNFANLADNAAVEVTIANLKANGIAEVVVVETKAEALEKIKTLIPAGSSVMNGASKTLEQVGYIDYLKSGTHGWNNLHATILAEADPVKQKELRRQSVLSDFYLGSAHAISETGELIIASNTGSQLPHIVYTSPNVIFVAGTQKIVKDLTQGMERLETHVYPLEDQRMKDVGYAGSQISKVVILKKENPMMGRKISVILVKEELGF